jgi:hypothetical protein
MISPPFNPDEQRPHEPSPVEKLTESILNLIALHKEADGLEDGECHAAIIIAMKNLDARLEEDDAASWVIPPRTGQWRDPELSA